MPDWHCPTCLTGRISSKEKSIKLIESKDSISLHTNPDFDFEWVYGWFTGILTCNNCSENVVFSGLYSVEQDVNDAGTGLETYKFISPKYFVPSIQILPNVDYCNSAISKSLLKSYELFWIDNSACSNAIRKIVELIMDEQKIEKTSLSKAGKRSKLTLHKRLEIFGLKNKTISELLLAIKWIGNDGSHSVNVLKREHIVKAFEILEFSLDKLYNKSSIHIIKAAKSINKSKGIKNPRKKKHKFGIR